jgi:hypothetical protein
MERVLQVQKGESVVVIADLKARRIPGRKRTAHCLRAALAQPGETSYPVPLRLKTLQTAATSCGLVEVDLQ